MAKNLTWRQARKLARQGRGIRLEEWRKWLVFDAYSKWWNIILPASGGVPQTVRSALSASASGGEPDASQFRFTVQYFRDLTWTDEPWDVASPAPRVPAADPVPAASSGSTSSVSSSGSGDGGKSKLGDDPEGIITTGGSGPSGGGTPGRALPTPAPAPATPQVKCSFRSDFTPGGPSCIVAGQLPATCRIIMTVKVLAPAVAGVFPIHLQLGAVSKPAENAWHNYVREHVFAATDVNPSGVLAATATKITIAATDYFATESYTFPPACDGDEYLTFAVRFTAELTIEVWGGGDLLESGTIAWDFTKVYVVPKVDATGAIAIELGASTFDYDWTLGGAAGSATSYIAPPSTITVDVAGTTVSNPMASGALREGCLAAAMWEIKETLGAALPPPHVTEWVWDSGETEDLAMV